MERCPECGIRLNGNYCDICMRRVSWKKMPTKITFQNVEGSSAHREEGHECVSFEKPEKKPLRRPIRTTVKRKRPETKGNKAWVIVAAVISLLSALVGMIDTDTEPVPEYNYEAFELDPSVPQFAPAPLYTSEEITVLADSAGLYYGDYAISLTIRNDSEQDIVVDTESLSVNGYMMGSSLYAEVPSEETAQAILSFDSWDLEEANISQVADMAFRLCIYDADSYEDIVTTDLITLKTNVKDYVQPVDVSGMELYRDDDLRLVLRSAGLTSFDDYELEFYAENLSGQEVSVYTDAVRVNGQESSGFLWCLLRPGTRAIDSIYLYELEEMGITNLEEVGEVSLDLCIETSQNGIIEQTVTETITFSP